MVLQDAVCRLLIGVGRPHRRYNGVQAFRGTQHLQPGLQGLFQRPHLAPVGVGPRLRQKAPFAVIHIGASAVISLPPGARLAHGAVHRLSMAFWHKYNNGIPGLFLIFRAKGPDIPQPQHLRQGAVHAPRRKVVIGVRADD